MKTLRIFVTIGLFFIPIIAFSQDTIYFNPDGLKVDTKLKAAYYQTLAKDNVQSNKIIERQYYLSGLPKKETYYLDYNRKIKDGTQKIWYNNGQLKSAVEYVDNKKQGLLLTYWENGQLKRKDTYENNKFKKGECFNADGSIKKHFDYQILPTFPGGEYKLLQFLKKTIVYPRDAMVMNIEGMVLVDFVILKDGTISNVALKSGISPELDQEALRVVKSMPKWIPASEDGDSIDCLFTIPIMYKTKI